MVTDNGSVLALDIGSARIGMALASQAARLATPAGALANDSLVIQQLRELCEREAVRHIVLGLPRGLSGQDTRQTAAVRAFGRKLVTHLALPISWQDEALTSAQAEAELTNRGKPYAKGDVDALAATYILEDYLRENL
jgi:putative Holliday junction resolvase